MFSVETDTAAPAGAVLWREPEWVPQACEYDYDVTYDRQVALHSGGSAEFTGRLIGRAAHRPNPKRDQRSVAYLWHTDRDTFVAEQRVFDTKEDDLAQQPLVRTYLTYHRTLTGLMARLAEVTPQGNLSRLWKIALKRAASTGNVEAQQVLAEQVDLL